MGKRFTDTNKYKKSFIRGLPGPYKLLWDYLYHDCDHAGIWHVDFEIAQVYLGKDMPVDQETALKLFNNGEERIKVLNCSTKWFIPSFIVFQYDATVDELNQNNQAHKGVLKILIKEGVIQEPQKPLESPLEGATQAPKDMDKDKDKDKEKDKEDVIKPEFKEIISDLNEKTGKSYKHTTGATKKLIQARWNDGFRTEDFKKVHSIMAAKWLTDPKMSQYLRPETLYSPKFESYLNTKVTLSEQGVISEKTEKGMSAIQRFIDKGEKK